MKAKTHLSQVKSRGGFTLVEMLVVISMIAALAGISFPVYRSIQKKVERQQFEMALASIERAVDNYETEYNYLPTAGGADNWDGEHLSTVAQMTTFITVLAGAESVANPVNFKGISFLDGTPEAKAQGGGFASGFHTNANGSVSFYLPWGTQFKHLVIDSDYDEMFRLPFITTTHKLPGKRIIAFEQGEDGIFNTDDDWGSFDYPGMPWTD